MVDDLKVLDGVIVSEGEGLGHELGVLNSTVSGGMSFMERTIIPCQAIYV
jgi:hypothetical protein